MPKKDKHPVQTASGRNNCYFCNAHGVEEHHIVPQRMNGTDHDFNLVSVCSVCHHKLETLYDKRFYEALGIKDESGERKTHLPCIRNDCMNSPDYLARNKGHEWLAICAECDEGTFDEYKPVNGHGEKEPERSERTRYDSSPSSIQQEVWGQ